MRNILKAATLESKFPLLAVESDCIVSKDADITVAFEVELPELFTVTSAEYAAIHAAWCKAVKVLPDYTVVHKQDWFVKEHYRSRTEGEKLGFLSRSYELHFNERPFLNHCCYLYLTKTTKERMRMQSSFSSLCRGFIIPKEVNRDTAARFLDAAGQFARIVNDTGLVRLRRLSGDEVTGTEEKTGLLEKYLCLSLEDTGTLEDIELGDDGVRIGDKRLSVYTLSELDALPGRVGTDSRYERLSTDRSDCRLSFASPVGLLLPCNHIYNQYLFIDDSAENLQRFEKTARNMQSLSRYSRSNQINKEWIDLYLNDAHSYGLTSVRCHCNVIAWTDNPDEVKGIRNDTGSQIAAMECKPRHDTVDAATLYWAGMPGNAADFPAEESFYTFIEQAVCFWTEETNYRSSLSPFGLKMSDRISGKPLHVDISDLPMKRGITTNRNKDTGNSYEGLCSLIHQKTGGEDGIYFTYTDEHPIAFNPFYTDDRVFDIEKRESIKTLLLTLWKKDNEPATRSEEVALSNAVSLYIERIKAGEVEEPSFNTFYEFVKSEYRRILEEKQVREKDFDLAGFLNVLEPYYRGGEYDFLLNSDKQLDLLTKRFIVFEIDQIKDHPILFPVTTIIIMELFINKMRRLKGIRKMVVIEEAWKAIASANMADYIRYLYKTVRKFYGEAVVVTQEVEDIISSPIVKESIINNSDCKILLDQRKYLNKFDQIQTLLGLTDKEKGQILSVNMSNDPTRKYKEVWFGLGGVQSAVYATETSLEEYLCYTTEESEKVEVQRMAEKLGGNIELAIKRLAEEKRNARKG